VAAVVALVVPVEICHPEARVVLVALVRLLLSLDQLSQGLGAVSVAALTIWAPLHQVAKETATAQALAQTQAVVAMAQLRLEVHLLAAQAARA
jgi:hypothetical protein